MRKESLVGQLILLILIILVASCATPRSSRDCPNNNKDYFRKQAGAPKVHIRYHSPV